MKEQFEKNMELYTQVFSGILDEGDVLERIQNGADPFYKKDKEDKSVAEMLIDNNNFDLANKVLIEYEKKIAEASSPKFLQKLDFTLRKSKKNDSDQNLETINKVKDSLRNYYDKCLVEKSKNIEDFKAFLGEKPILKSEAISFCMEFAIENINSDPLLLNNVVSVIIKRQPEVAVQIANRLVSLSDQKGEKIAILEKIDEVLTNKQLKEYVNKNTYVYGKLSKAEKDNLEKFEKLTGYSFTLYEKNELEINASIKDVRLNPTGKLEEITDKANQIEEKFKKLVEYNLIDEDHESIKNNKQIINDLSLLKGQDISEDFINILAEFDDEVKYYDKLTNDLEDKRSKIYDNMEEIYSSLKNTKLPISAKQKLENTTLSIIHAKEKMMINEVVADPSKFNEIEKFAENASKHNNYLKWHLDETIANEENLKIFLQRKAIDKMENKSLSLLLEQEVDLTNYKKTNSMPGNLGNSVFNKVLGSLEDNPDLLDNFVKKAKEQIFKRYSDEEERNIYLSDFVGFILKNTDDKNIDKTNLIFLAIDKNLKDYLTNYQAFDLGQAILAAKKAENHEFLSLMVEKFHKEIAVRPQILDINSLKLLYDKDHKESVKSLLSSEKAVAQYIKQAADFKDDEKQEIDVNFVKFIIENNKTYKVPFYEDKVVNFLLDKAVESKDNDFLVKVVVDVLSNVSTTALSYLNKSAPDLYKGIIAGENKEIKKALLGNKDLVENLSPVEDKKIIENLAEFYDPKEESHATYFKKLVESGYNRDYAIGKMIDELKANFSNNQNNILPMFGEDLTKNIENYYSQRMEFDKKPIVTALKAIFIHFKSPEKYKEDKLNEISQKTNQIIKEDIKKNDPDRIAENAVAYEQALEIKGVIDQKEFEEIQNSSKKRSEDLERQNKSREIDRGNPEHNKTAEGREGLRSRVAERQEDRRNPSLVEASSIPNSPEVTPNKVDKNSAFLIK